MANPAPKKYVATRDFNDAGTEKAFAAGDDVSSEAGIANYVAAGLAAEPDAAAPKPATTQQPAV